MQIIVFFVILLWITPEGVAGNDVSHRVTALILARGGSKGIPLKNIAKVDGVSLLARTVMTARDAYVFDEVWVSTDHPEIADEAHKYGAKVFDRSPEFAQDESTSISAVQEFLRANPLVEHVALLQCTSPFLSVDYVRQMIDAYNNKECAFSVTRSFKLRWKLYDDSVQPINFDITHRPRRQDWDGELIEAGMFYLAPRYLLEKGLFQTERCGVVVVDPLDALEIDNPVDLLVAEAVLKYKHHLVQLKLQEESASCCIFK